MVGIGLGMKFGIQETDKDCYALVKARARRDPSIVLVLGAEFEMTKGEGEGGGAHTTRIAGKTAKLTRHRLTYRQV